MGDIFVVATMDLFLLARVAVSVVMVEAPLQEEQPPGTPEILVAQVLQELRPPL
jgi:hypothetical protein